MDWILLGAFVSHQAAPLWRLVTLRTQRGRHYKDVSLSAVCQDLEFLRISIEMDQNMFFAKGKLSVRGGGVGGGRTKSPGDKKKLD